MIYTCRERLPREAHVSSEMGGALVSAVLILLLITVFATAGFWLSRAEYSAAQGYAQASRALYTAEAGFARYFAARLQSDSIDMTFEYYADPCADTLLYPTQAEQDTCAADDDNEEEELLEDLEMTTPPPQADDFLDASVIVTAEFIMNNGTTPIYELFAHSTVTDSRDVSLSTTRLLAMYGALSPPFDINAVFTSVGGIEFGGDADDHYHFDGKAKAGKDGACGTEVPIPNLTVPLGQWDLPLPDADCPGGKNCPYKWHSKGVSSPADVDSTFTTAAAIKADMGIDWTEMLSSSFYSGVTGVVALNDSGDLMDMFESGDAAAWKSASEWPIVRYTGDLTTDQRVKGYGILIVDGDIIVTNDKLEWTGIILVGGTITTQDGAHIHVKGAAIAGLGCTEQEVTDGDCRSNLDGDHNDMKYRPCEIAQSWHRMMIMEPRDGLWREISGN